MQRSEPWFCEPALREAAEREAALPPEQRRYEPVLRAHEALSALRPSTLEGQRAARELIDQLYGLVCAEGL